jgi:hypothetical protein
MHERQWERSRGGWTAGAIHEEILAWQHLSRSGYLSISYRMLTGETTATPLNTPRNVFGGYSGARVRSQLGIQRQRRTRHNIKTGNYVTAAVLGEVDRKIDDGQPGSGRFSFSRYAASAPPRRLRRRWCVHGRGHRNCLMGRQAITTIAVLRRCVLILESDARRKEIQTVVTLRTRDGMTSRAIPTAQFVLIFFASLRLCVKRFVRSPKIKLPRQQLEQRAHRRGNA